MVAHKDIGSQIRMLGSVAPGDRAAGAVNGTGIDRMVAESGKGYLSCVLFVQTGAASGSPTAQTVDAKIQDSADNSTFADYTDPTTAAAAAITQITADSTNREKDVNLSNAKRYVRVVLTVAFTGGTSPLWECNACLALGGSATSNT